MLTGGDEYLRSLNCNNNPYDVDSVGNWLNYNWTEDQKNFNIFARRMIAFRKAHPALRPQSWYSAADKGNGMVQLQWYTPTGAIANASYWGDPSKPLDRVANRRHRVRRHRFGDLYRLQRLVRHRKFHVARAGRRQELVPGD